jgi:hypothetical protein
MTHRFVVSQIELFRLTPFLLGQPLAELGQLDPSSIVATGQSGQQPMLAMWGK